MGIISWVILGLIAGFIGSKGHGEPSKIAAGPTRRPARRGCAGRNGRWCYGRSKVCRTAAARLPKLVY
jgi:hypothetical protein